MIEPALIGAASGLLASGIALASFMALRAASRTAMSDRITRCEESGEGMLRAAAEIDNDLKDMVKKHSLETGALHIKVEAANAAWNLRWETALRTFVSSEQLRDVERRLMDAGAASEKRITDVVSGLVRRVDSVMDGRGRQQ